MTANKLLWGVLLSATVFWSPVKNQCRQATCQVRSVLRNAYDSSQALMKVQLGTSSTTKDIKFNGQDTQRTLTEFSIERCVGSNFKVVATIRWKADRRYYLAVKSGQVILGNASSVTDSHRFVLAGNVACGIKCNLFKSVSSGSLIMTNRHGVVTLGSATFNRGTWFNMSCWK